MQENGTTKARKSIIAAVRIAELQLKLKSLEKKMIQNPLIVESTKSNLSGLSKGTKDYSYREFPVSGAMNRVWVNLEKLKFYLGSKQVIKFRLLRRPEYVVEGTVVEIKDNNQEKAMVIIKLPMSDETDVVLDNNPVCLICIEEIDSNTIFPADYEPIRFFQRTSISEDLRQEVFKRDNYECQIKSEGCQGKATEVDHIIPVSKGGLNNLENLQASCLSCNRKKSDKI